MRQFFYTTPIVAALCAVLSGTSARALDATPILGYQVPKLSDTMLVFPTREYLYQYLEGQDVSFVCSMFYVSELKVQPRNIGLETTYVVEADDFFQFGLFAISIDNLELVGVVYPIGDTVSFDEDQPPNCERGLRAGVAYTVADEPTASEVEKVVETSHE